MRHRHNKAKCSECLDIPAVKHHCQALVAVCQDCGHQHPVIADPCQSQDKCHKMLVTEGTIEGKTVHELQDTSCMSFTCSWQQVDWTGRTMHPHRWYDSTNSCSRDLCRNSILHWIDYSCLYEESTSKQKDTVATKFPLSCQKEPSGSGQETVSSTRETQTTRQVWINWRVGVF